jgi:hypothetical protein
MALALGETGTRKFSRLSFAAAACMKFQAMALAAKMRVNKLRHTSTIRGFLIIIPSLPGERFVKAALYRYVLTCQQKNNLFYIVIVIY